MKEYSNKRISEVSWIQRGGVATHYYEPETIEELRSLISTFYENKQNFDLVGLTSNIYFKNTYNVDNLVSTKRLTHYQENDSIIFAACGVNVARMSRDMMEKGIKGFEGLIDLPGTVGGGIFGNSGCYGCLLSDMLIKAEVLLPDGSIKIYEKRDLGFRWRSSDFKTGVKEGIILSAYFRKNLGNRQTLMGTAMRNHDDRKLNQPGPKHNLGTTYCTLGERTRFGKLLNVLAAVYYRVLKVRGLNEKIRLIKRWQFELTLAGGRVSLPYLFNLQRFMWLDHGADKAFIVYNKAIRRIYLKPILEIEIKG